MSRNSLLLTLAAGLAVYGGYKVYQRRHIAPQLATVMAQGATILDVRTPWEYAQGHVPGSVNVPLSQLHLPVLPLDSTRTYVTCCSHGLRSVKAVQLLQAHGFRHVYNGGVWSDLRRYGR